MCTLSVIRPAPQAVRVAMSRDESTLRPAALPPRLWRLGARLALLPVDPQGGGSWIGVNDAGLVAALLNRNDSAEARPGRLSRGAILPRLLAHDSIEDAASDLPAPRDNAPYRLLLLDGGDALLLSSDGERVAREPEPPVGAAFVLSSSGLGDRLVQRPRRRLFERLVDAAAPQPRQQDAFHAHRWSGMGSLSVVMSRPGARTVSLTTIDLTPGLAEMRYHEVSDRPLPPTRILRLPLRERVTA